MTVRVRVVGAVSVESDGRLLADGALTARRARLLLVALATADHPLPAERLAARLWDTPPATWSAALRGALAALRTALEPLDLGGQRLIRTRGDGWAVADDSTTDLADAATLVDRAEHALADQDAGTALPIAQQAVSLLTGEVLPAEEGGWIDALRRTRAALELRALGVASDAAAQVGRWEAAIDAATRLIERDVLDEGAHRRVIRALAGSGDRAGAIRAFERCREVLVAELGVDPGPDTTALYLEILQSGSMPSGAVPPRARNRFVGRDRELRAVLDGLAAGTPVTIVGRGGMGKSRLALEVVHDRRLEAPGGRYWVGLGDLPDAALLPSTLAKAVGADPSAEPLAAVVAALAPVDRVVLVFDGGERHRDVLAEIATTLVAQVPRIAILSTARGPIGIDREARVELGPLAVSDGAETDLLRVRLAERPGGADARPLDGTAVSRLAGRLGGAPLAIELAVAQLATLSVDDLLDGIDDAAARADGVLEALVDQGYSSLDEQEARLVRALGVVEGAVPLRLARAIAGTSIPEPRVARVLGALAEAGFVTVDRARTRWRYGLDPHLRSFARSRSADAEQTADLAALAEALGQVLPADAREPPAPYRDAIDDATDAIRTVFTAALAGHGDRDTALGLAFRLHRHWASTGLVEGRLWLERLLDGADATEAAALARFAAGYLAYWAGDAPAATDLLPAAADELETAQPEFAARALLYAAGMSDEIDEPERALDQIQRSLAIARTLHTSLQSAVELGLASVQAERGDAGAVASLDSALAAFGPSAPESQRWAAHANAAMCAWRVGDLTAARRFARVAEPLLATGPGIAKTQLVIGQTGVALATGDPHTALRLATELLDDQRALGSTREVPLIAGLAVRAALLVGDAVAARAHATAALAAAIVSATPATAALALEAVVAVEPDAADAAVLAASAALVRSVGRRPPPPGLRPAASSAHAAPIDWHDALGRANDALA